MGKQRRGLTPERRYERDQVIKHGWREKRLPWSVYEDLRRELEGFWLRWPKPADRAIRRSERGTNGEN